MPSRVLFLDCQGETCCYSSSLPLSASNCQAGPVCTLYEMSCGSPIYTGEFRSSYGRHLLDHLAAHGTSLTGGQVAVVALLEVHANLAGSFHLELVHSLAGPSLAASILNLSIASRASGILMRLDFLDILFLLLHFHGSVRKEYAFAVIFAPSPHAAKYCFPCRTHSICTAGSNMP